MPYVKLTRAMWLTVALIHGLARPSEVEAAPTSVAPDGNERASGQDDNRTIQGRIFHLEESARAAAAAGEHVRAASLYLQAERLLPVRATNARAERIRQAVLAFREAARVEPVSGAAYVKRALVVLDGFLLEAETSGAEPVDLMSLSALRSELAERQEDWVTQIPPPAIERTRPAPNAPLTRSAPVRSRGLELGLGITAGLTLATAVAALGTRLRVLEGGKLHGEIILAAKASTKDFDASNDVSPHSPDICVAVRNAGGVTYNVEVYDLCQEHRNTLHASNGLWITAGALAGTSMILLGLLLARRRKARESPRAVWVDGAPMRSGIAVHARWTF